MTLNLDTARRMKARRQAENRDKLIQRLKANKSDLAESIANLKIDWYKITNKTDAEDTTEVYLYEEIDAYGWWGVSAEMFIDELNKINTGKISLRINSPGGDVFDAIAIYNALVSHPANVTVYVDSLAASAASVITCSGDKIVMMVGSQIMIHDAMGFGMGNAAELREYATFLDQQSDNIATIYASRAGGDPADWRALMLKETWANAPEAVELGLADEVYTKPEPSQEDPDKKDPVPEEPSPDETDPEEETSTEDDVEDDEETDDTEDELDEELQDLLNIRHSLVNSNWKFNGRSKAPAPIQNGLYSESDLDMFIRNLQRK
jgi:ATP-dependent protease ClpP protease subunit